MVANASTSSSRSRPVIPAFDEYDGDPAIKKLLIVSQLPVARTLEGEFSSAYSTVVSVSGSAVTGVSTQNIQAVGGPRGNRGECH